MQAPEFPIDTSRLSTALVTLAATCALLAAAMTGWQTFALTAGMAAAVALYQSRIPEIRAVLFGPNSRIRLRYGQGREFSGTLDGPAFVSPFYIGFRIRTGEGQGRSVGLFRDAVGEEDFRAIAARLRYPDTPEHA